MNASFGLIHKFREVYRNIKEKFQKQLVILQIFIRTTKILCHVTVRLYRNWSSKLSNSIKPISVYQMSKSDRQKMGTGKNRTCVSGFHVLGEFVDSICRGQGHTSVQTLNSLIGRQEGLSHICLSFCFSELNKPTIINNKFKKKAINRTQQ